MTISRVGFASANGTSLTLPTHQAGDFIAISAFRDGYTAGSLSVPSGWLMLDYRAAGQFQLATAYQIANGSAEVSGTWTGATQIIAVVYRHATHILAAANRTVANAGSATISYTAMSGGASGVSSVTDKWAIGVAGVILNSTDAETAPTGMTNVTSIAGASTGELVWHDSNANISWSTNRTVTINTSTQHGEIVFEVVQTNLLKSSGGGFRAVNIRGGADQ